MNRKRIFLLLLVGFVLLMCLAGVLYETLGARQPANILSAQQPPVPLPVSPAGDGAAQDGAAQEKDAAQTPAPQKTRAPDFTVYDRDGNEVHLSDYLGQPVVLNFWASWCGPCKLEMPDFEEKWEALGEEIAFLMVNMTDGSRETVETASAFIEAQGYAFPVFFDTDIDAAMTYGVYSIPQTYFIDADGCAVAQATGAIDAQTLQKGIALLDTAG